MKLSEEEIAKREKDKTLLRTMERLLKFNRVFLSGQDVAHFRKMRKKQPEDKLAKSIRDDWRVIWLDKDYYAEYAILENDENLGDKEAREQCKMLREQRCHCERNWCCSHWNTDSLHVRTTGNLIIVVHKVIRYT